MAFCWVFDDNLKIPVVVSKNNERFVEVLHISNNVNYMPWRYRGSKTIKAMTLESESVEW